MNPTSVTPIKKLSSCLITGLLKTEPELNDLKSVQTTAIAINNSLAYLAYQNRQKKGLISDPNEESPVILFGDEWVF